MVLRRHALLPLSLALVLVSQAASAGGPERHRSFHNHRNGGVTSPNGLPSVVPGIGTYSGAISGVRIRGVGNYFMVSGSLRSADRPVLAPKARIIEVEGASACSYEVGVCVVRP